MRFVPTKLAGACIVELEPHEDSRGSFARTFCAREFAEQQIMTAFVQCSLSFNRRRGTLRGLHYQMPPASEAKLVRCAVGSLYDVIVDMRRDSPTYLQHVGVELTGGNNRCLYVPEMFAHGFQTLEDQTQVFYQISQFYMPEKAAGLRFDDPALCIEWPLPVAEISEKDCQWPLLEDTSSRS